MPGAARPVQGGAYSGPRSEPGGQNTPRAGRVVASYGTYSNAFGTFAQQVDQGDIFDDASIATVIASGVSVEDYAYDEIVSGTSIASGSGVESYNTPVDYTDSGLATVTFSGVSVESYSFTDSGSDTVTTSGSGTESYSFTDSGLVTVTTSGTNVESQTFTDSSSITVTSSGVSVESYSFVDSGIVTVIASGTGVASQTYTDNRTCTITVLGSGFPTYTPYDAVLNEDNPVSHWKLGDANTAIDRRRTLNLPAISGPISTAAGLVANNANDQSNVFTGVANVSFDAGSGGILGVPYQGAYTMEAWVKPTADANSTILKRTAGTLLGLGDTGNGTQVQLRLSFENSANAVFSLLSPSSYFLTINKTYHIVGTYDGTTAILYINGVEAVRTTSVGVGGIRSSLTIPPFIGASYAGAWPFAVIDEVAWYNGALTPARILAHYQAGVATSYDAVIDADSPVSHWKLGWNTTKAVDRGRRKLDLDAQNPPIAISGKGIVYQSDNDRANTFVTGSSQRFVRSDSSLADSDGSLYDTANLSIEAWIKPTAVDLVGGSWGVIRRPLSDSQLYLISSKPVFEFKDSNAAIKNVTSPTSLVAGANYHLVGTYDGATLILYVNGVEMSRLASATGIRSDPTAYPQIGYTGGQYWDGDIDEVAWYDTALSPARVRAHFLAGLAGYITVSGSGVETAVYTNSASGSVTASGSGIETVDYVDNVLGSITASGSGVEDYQAAADIVYTDSVFGTIAVLGTSSESIAVDDTRTGLVIASGTGTDAFSASDTSIGTLTASGIGTDSSTHIGSATGSITASGSSLDTAVHTGSGTGSLTAFGTAVDAYIYSDTGTGTIAVTGTGTELGIYSETGTGSITALGTAVDAYIYSDTGTGTITVTGTGTDLSVRTGSGTSSITASGTAVDAYIYSDTGTGTIESTGTGTDTFIHSGLSSDTAVVAGSSFESATYADSATGTALASGTGTDIANHSSNAIGTIVASGTGLDSRVYDDAGSGTTLLSGTGVDSWAILIGYIDTCSGQINTSGSGVESQSHTSTTIGSLVVEGTGVESQLHTSTAIGTLVVEGTGSETYDNATGYTDSSIGTITSTGTGDDSAVYSYTVTGTVTFLSSGVDSFVGEDTSIGTIVLTGTARENSGYTQSTQPVSFSTVVVLNRINVRLWNKTSIQSVVTNTASLMVQIALKNNVKTDVTERDQTKVLITKQ